MPALTDAVPERLRRILDDRVFSFAQAAQRHFQSNDLVAVLDLRDEAPELQALPRQPLSDAFAELGKPDQVRQVFVGFQRHLYAAQEARQRATD